MNRQIIEIDGDRYSSKMINNRAISILETERDNLAYMLEMHRELDKRGCFSLSEEAEEIREHINTSFSRELP